MSSYIDYKYNYHGVKLINKSIVRKRYELRPPDPGDSNNYWKILKNVISKQIKKPNPIVVPVHKFNFKIQKDGTVKYTYDMSRCELLTREEEEVINKYWADNESTLRDWGSKYKKLFRFLKKVNKSSYMDLHLGNIMKYRDNYVLIDLEGFL